MADKNIRKETKKKKKADKSTSTTTYSAPRPAIVQPELIKKEKKNK